MLKYIKSKLFSLVFVQFLLHLRRQTVVISSWNITLKLSVSTYSVKFNIQRTKRMRVSILHDCTGHEVWSPCLVIFKWTLWPVCVYADSVTVFCEWKQHISHAWLESSDVMQQQFWDQTSCRGVEGSIHAQRAPGLLPAHVVSDECIKTFLRCLFDTSLTILRRFSVSTLLSAFYL